MQIHYFARINQNKKLAVSRITLTSFGERTLPFELQPVSGTNVIGVVHASRSPSVEAILLAVALEKQNINAMATALALASHCRG